MKVTTRKKPCFREYYEGGVFSRIVATPTEQGRWRLFGIYGKKDIAVFVEAARGGIREWSGLNYVADFCFSMGIELWEVHNRTKRSAAAINKQ